MENRCTECGKRIPQRNDQVNLACQKAGLCRSCYETAPNICKACNQPLPRVNPNPADENDAYEQVINFACRQVRLCRYCYDAFAPESGDKTTLQEILDRVGGDYSQFIADEETDESPYGWLDQFFGKDR
jgi:hypothetical protein